MAKQDDFLKAIKEGYDFKGESIKIGRAELDGKIVEGADIFLPLKTFNRHGLIAGATGTDSFLAGDDGAEEDHFGDSAGGALGGDDGGGVDAVGFVAVGEHDFELPELAVGVHERDLSQGVAVGISKLEHQAVADICPFAFIKITNHVSYPTTEARGRED